MTCYELLEKNTLLIKKLLKDLKIDYTLEYMLINFKSLILAVEAKRSRIAAVAIVDEKKTKRVYIKTAVHKEFETTNEELIKCNMLIGLYKSIKNLNELEQIEKDLKISNSTLLYEGMNYYKEIGTTLD